MYFTLILISHVFFAWKVNETVYNNTSQRYVVNFKDGRKACFTHEAFPKAKMDTIKGMSSSLGNKCFKECW